MFIEVFKLTLHASACPVDEAEGIMFSSCPSVCVRARLGGGTPHFPTGFRSFLVQYN